MNKKHSAIGPLTLATAMLLSTSSFGSENISVFHNNNIAFSDIYGLTSAFNDADSSSYDMADSNSLSANNIGNTNANVDTKKQNNSSQLIESGTRPTDVGKGSMYVSNFFSTNISVIDTSSNDVVDTITVDARPQGIAFDSLNERIYAINGLNISLIDPTFNVVLDTITAGNNFPNEIAFDSLNQRMYVSNFGSANVSVIDTSANDVIKTIKIGLDPFQIAFALLPA